MLDTLTPSTRSADDIEKLWDRTDLNRQVDWLELILGGSSQLHPRKLTWNLKTGLPDRKVVFQPSIFRGFCC